MRHTLKDSICRVISRKYVGLGRSYLCRLMHLLHGPARLFNVTITSRLEGG